MWITKLLALLLGAYFAIVFMGGLVDSYPKAERWFAANQPWFAIFTLVLIPIYYKFFIYLFDFVKTISE